MSKLLLRLFANGDPELPKTRAVTGKLSGIVGIVCNVLLFAMKLLVGILSGAVSITADAMNNLSDATSSVVTLIGFRLADAVGTEAKNTHIGPVLHHLPLEIRQREIRLGIRKAAVQHADLFESAALEQLPEPAGIGILLRTVLLKIAQIIFGIGVAVTDDGHRFIPGKCFHRCPF